MKRVGWSPGAALATVLFAACGGPVGTAPVESTNVESAQRVAPPPAASALLALDRQANEAYFRGDSAFLGGLLSDRFVMLGPDGARLDKSASLGWIAGVRCDVDDGWALDEPRLSAIDPDTYVLTYRGTFEGTCTQGGRTEKLPSPVRAATVWVRSGEAWRAAFHGENPILDPRAAAAPAAAPAPPKRASKEDAAGAPGPSPSTPAVDPGTVAMAAIETAVWEGWEARDAEALEALTAESLAFVDIFGNATSGKAETLEFWTAHACDVRSTRVADATGTALSATVGILTFEGILEGTCGGQEFPVIHGTSVYTKQGNDWKLAFTLNHLTK